MQQAACGRRPAAGCLRPAAAAVADSHSYGGRPLAAATCGRRSRSAALCCLQPPPLPRTAAPAAGEGRRRQPVLLRTGGRGLPPLPAAEVPGLAVVLEADGPMK